MVLNRFILPAMLHFYNQELIDQIKQNQELIKFIIDKIESSELYFQFQKLNSKWIYMIRIDSHFFHECNNKLLIFNLSILINTLAKSEVGNILESLKSVCGNKFYGFITYVPGFVSYWTCLVEHCSQIN